MQWFANKLYLQPTVLCSWAQVIASFLQSCVSQSSEPHPILTGEQRSLLRMSLSYPLQSNSFVIYLTFISISTFLTVRSNAYHWISSVSCMCKLSININTVTCDLGWPLTSYNYLCHQGDQSRIKRIVGLSWIIWCQKFTESFLRVVLWSYRPELLSQPGLIGTVQRVFLLPCHCRAVHWVTSHS